MPTRNDSRTDNDPPISGHHDAVKPWCPERCENVVGSRNGTTSAHACPAPIAEPPRSVWERHNPLTHQPTRRCRARTPAAIAPWKRCNRALRLPTCGTARYPDTARGIAPYKRLVPTRITEPSGWPRSVVAGGRGGGSDGAGATKRVPTGLRRHVCQHGLLPKTTRAMGIRGVFCPAVWRET